MIVFNKRIIGGICALLLVCGGLEAGKKKHNDSKKLQQKSEDLNALMQQLKIRDEKRAQEDAHKKQAELQQQEEDKKLFPSRVFLGSQYGESHKEYIKRLNQAIGISDLQSKLIENGFNAVKCYEKRNKIVCAQNSGFSVSEEEVLFNVHAPTAESIALLYQFKDIVPYVEESLSADWQNHNVEEEERALMLKRDQLKLYLSDSALPHDVREVARQLLGGFFYYVLACNELYLIREFKKLHQPSRKFDSLHQADEYKINAALLEYTNVAIKKVKYLFIENRVHDGQELVNVSEELKKAVANITPHINNFKQERERITAFLAQADQEKSAQQQVRAQAKDLKLQKQQESVIRKQQAQQASAAHNKSLVEQASQDDVAQESQVVQQQKPMDFIQAISKPALQQQPQLTKKTIIKKYNQATVCNWFVNPAKALEREIQLYPATNATPAQRSANYIAHTFPFEMDEYVECLADKECLDDGGVFYRIPGSIVNHATGTEETVEFGWGIDRNGKCFHRSATRRLYCSSSLQQQTAVNIASASAQQDEDGGVSIVSPNLCIIVKPFALHFKDDARKLTYKLSIVGATA